MECVDVAVIGGGPAGASAGEAAAVAGAEVVVLEKGVPRSDRDAVGPDSTDAGGFLNYWLDIADIDYRNIPRDVILKELHGVRFIGPSEYVSFRTSAGERSSAPRFGFTFDRARFDDWLRDRAERAGAGYRVGARVAEVEADLRGPNYVRLHDGHEIEAEHLVLADGPGRSVTVPTLDQFMPQGSDVVEYLGPRRANHIAYQEHRRMPNDVFDSHTISFWWGWVPGETAYIWVFPNDRNTARIGLTMPMNLEANTVDEPSQYRLLRAEEDHRPDGGEYVRRFLEEAYPRYDPSAFPIITDRGKSSGTESYPISSTRPVDSPVRAKVAVVGGAMGTTSAFHEGGYHLAMRTGKIAGRLAGRGELHRYNDAWKRAIGTEIVRNTAAGATVSGFGPAQWDRSLATIDRLQRATSDPHPKHGGYLTWASAAGRTGIFLAARYAWHRYRLGGGKYVQLRESQYVYK